MQRVVRLATMDVRSVMKWIKQFLQVKYIHEMMWYREINAFSSPEIFLLIFKTIIRVVNHTLAPSHMSLLWNLQFARIRNIITIIIR